MMKIEPQIDRERVFKGHSYYFKHTINLLIHNKHEKEIGRIGN